MRLEKIIRMNARVGNTVESCIEEALRYAKDNSVIVDLEINEVEIRISNISRLENLLKEFHAKISEEKKVVKSEEKSYDKKIMQKYIIPINKKDWFYISDDVSIYGCKYGMCAIRRYSAITKFDIMENGENHYCEYRMSCTKKEAMRIAKVLLKEIK